MRLISPFISTGARFALAVLTFTTLLIQTGYCAATTITALRQSTCTYTDTGIGDFRVVTLSLHGFDCAKSIGAMIDGYCIEGAGVKYPKTGPVVEDGKCVFKFALSGQFACVLRALKCHSPEAPQPLACVRHLLCHLLWPG